MPKGAESITVDFRSTHDENTPEYAKDIGPSLDDIVLKFSHHDMAFWSLTESESDTPEPTNQAEKPDGSDSVTPVSKPVVDEKETPNKESDTSDENEVDKSDTEIVIDFSPDIELEAEPKPESKPDIKPEPETKPEPESEVKPEPEIAPEPSVPLNDMELWFDISLPPNTTLPDDITLVDDFLLDTSTVIWNNETDSSTTTPTLPPEIVESDDKTDKTDSSTPDHLDSLLDGFWTESETVYLTGSDVI